MSELVRKIDAVCAFGSPDVATTREIVEEVQALLSKLAEIREFARMWESAAEGQSTGDLRMGDILEVLNR